jgi:hypothetical protein
MCPYDAFDAGDARMSSPSTETATIDTPTPIDLTITPRDRRFGRSIPQERWWCGGDPVATAVYNALSVTFPSGEAFFIEAVKAHREGVPPKLAQEIRAFVQQEIMHTREHVAFNKKVEDAGYDIAPLEQAVVDTLEMIKGRPKIVDLAVAMALEHYTAILAHMILTDKDSLGQLDGEWAELWRWHAVEEIEHKGVAYDTWLYATRDWSRWRRWRAKSLTMLLVSGQFWIKRFQGMLYLMQQDGITGWTAKRRLAWYMLGTPGVIRKLAVPWAKFFLPGFHPWNEDDRGLIGRFDSDYADANLPMPDAVPA